MISISEKEIRINTGISGLDDFIAIEILKGLENEGIYAIEWTRDNNDIVLHLPED